MDSLIKHTSNTDEARGLLQRIENNLDCYSKVVRGDEEMTDVLLTLSLVFNLATLLSIIYLSKH